MGRGLDRAEGRHCVEKKINHDFVIQNNNMLCNSEIVIFHIVLKRTFPLGMAARILFQSNNVAKFSYSSCTLGRIFFNKKFRCSYIN